MKLPTSLQSFWNLPLEERKYYYLSEDLVKGYPIKDSKESLVDVEEFFNKNNAFIVYNPPNDIQGIVTSVRLRQTAAQKLLEAAQKLPEGYTFSISEGYRPLWYQKKCFEEIHADLAKEKPQLSKKKLYNLTTTYIADPNLCPPHSTGGAVDITILDNNGTMLEMGSDMNTVGEISNTFVEGLTEKARKNRQLLYDVLTSVGFVNLPSEWWHYSYGDQYWAIFNEKHAALYDKIDVQ